LALSERIRQTWKRLRGGTLSPGRAALSIGVGLFIGCVPVYGVQFVLVAAICVPLRLDTALAYLAAHISNPVTLFPILVLEVAVGSLLMTGHFAVPSFASMKHDHGFWRVGGQAAVGSVIVASVIGSVGGGIAWFLGQRVRDARRADFAAGRVRTLARYASAPPPARHYVGSKLRMDPAIFDIASLEGDFGRVVDAACGFGHVGLALKDLDRVRSIDGFDADPSRIAVARLAGGGDVFHVERLEDAAFPEADTVLVVDALHYLPVATQDVVLARAVHALVTGGRLIVREVDANRSVQSRLTQWSERRAVRRVHADAEAGFRSRSELTSALERLGLSTVIVVNEDFSVFENVLVVGTKVPEPAANASAATLSA
jgi:uncharacterized protein (DUF2062 family)/2-polyprenyl-3-methyl-5-hydroxy-6-metoxy-1,4-benzoquinol methylase